MSDEARKRNAKELQRKWKQFIKEQNENTRRNANDVLFCLRYAGWHFSYGTADSFIMLGDNNRC